MIEPMKAILVYLRLGSDMFFHCLVGPTKKNVLKR
jgi:hypothetical protein